MNRLLILVISLFTFNACAEPTIESDDFVCSVEMKDLTQNFQIAGKENHVTLTISEDPDSNEPIHRYVLPQSNGSIITVEQRHCSIYNLTVAVLLPNEVKLKDILPELSNTLESTDVWKKWFVESNAKEIFEAQFESTKVKEHLDQVGGIGFHIDDKLSATDENSETHFSMFNFGPHSQPYKSMISLYIGVGGL